MLKTTILSLTNCFRKKFVPEGISDAEGVIAASGVWLGESAAGEVAGGFVEPVGELAAA